LFAGCLLAVQGRFGDRPFLVITDEMAVLTVSEHRDALAGRFRFRLPPQDVVLALHNKARFHEFAVANHLPVPRSEIISHVGDFARIRTLRLPVIIKPVDKRHFHTGKIPRLVTADTSMSAIAASERLLETTGELIVQERTEGPDDSIYFCLFYCGGEGVPVSMFTGRKLASNPPGTGSTAFCTAAAEPRQHLEALTRMFLECVDYAGFGSVEYKWDRLAQRFVIIEPTVGRTDWQEEIATLCGVNIPLEAFRFEHAIPPPPATGSCKPVVWQASHLDRLLLARGSFPSDATVIDGYWRADDPLPAIIHYPMNVFSIARAHTLGWLRLSGNRYKPYSRKQRAY
jgi:D-aspartate ligase